MSPYSLTNGSVLTILLNVKLMNVGRSFDAGITTVQNHPYVEHLLAVGRSVSASIPDTVVDTFKCSYDSMVSLFDMRKPLVPLSKTDVGGGAWRVKWHPSASRKNDLLVACMHDGFKLLRFDELGSEPASLIGPYSGSSGSIVQHFDKHESLAYGVDWSFAQSSNDKKTAIASCSFYDHSLRFWSA